MYMSGDMGQIWVNIRFHVAPSGRAAARGQEGARRLPATNPIARVMAQINLNGKEK